MKKIVLIAAMAFLTVAAGAQTKFAHVNFTELIQLTDEADAARAQLSAAQKEAQQTDQSMIQEFQTKAQQYQQKASTWTQAIRESKEKELADIQQRIQEFEQNVQQELANQQQQLFAPIQQKAQETVEKLAKAGHYIYVFEVSQLLYFDPSQSTDLTPAARKALGIKEGRTLESLQQELQAAAQAPAQE